MSYIDWNHFNYVKSLHGKHFDILMDHTLSHVKIIDILCQQNGRIIFSVNTFLRIGDHEIVIIHFSVCSKQIARFMAKLTGILLYRT